MREPAEEMRLAVEVSAPELVSVQVPDAWPNIFRQSRFLSAVDYVQADRLRRKVALEMARIAAADGISTIVCTPHIYPGMYDNNAAGIREAVTRLQAHLDEAGIPLRLLAGADAHLCPDMPAQIRADRIPTLAGSRYLLLEPPHHAPPPSWKDPADFGSAAEVYGTASFYEMFKLVNKRLSLLTAFFSFSPS